MYVICVFKILVFYFFCKKKEQSNKQLQNYYKIRSVGYDRIELYESFDNDKLIRFKSLKIIRLYKNFILIN
jgi:hypothetical protein